MLLLEFPTYASPPGEIELPVQTTGLSERIKRNYPPPDDERISTLSLHAERGPHVPMIEWMDRRAAIVSKPIPWLL